LRRSDPKLCDLANLWPSN